MISVSGRHGIFYKREVKGLFLIHGNLSACQDYDPFSHHIHNLFIMSGHNDRRSPYIDLVEELNNLPGRLGIEISRGLIGNENQG